MKFMFFDITHRVRHESVQHPDLEVANDTQPEDQFSEDSQSEVIEFLITTMPDCN